MLLGAPDQGYRRQNLDWPHPRGGEPATHADAGRYLADGGPVSLRSASLFRALARRLRAAAGGGLLGPRGGFVGRQLRRARGVGDRRRRDGGHLYPDAPILPTVATLGARAPGHRHTLHADDTQLGDAVLARRGVGVEEPALSSRAIVSNAVIDDAW